MATVKFVNAVIYKGYRHSAHEPFDVDDAEIESLRADGAIVVVPPAPLPLVTAGTEDETGKTETPPVTPLGDVTPPAGNTTTPPDGGAQTPPVPDPAAEAAAALEKEIAALADMTVPQLKEYAKSKSIEIKSSVTLKDDIRAVIEDALSFTA